MSRFQHGKFETFGENEGLPSDNIRAVFLDRQIRLWVGSTVRADGKFTYRG